jgi:NADP-dependent 3-hydroxy acid dehydrogenase YdfG
MFDQLRMKDKVAVVTGASSGLGQKFAVALAEAGAVVVLTGRDEQRLASTANEIKAAGGVALAVSFDITDQEAVNRSFAFIASELGHIDLLVNNAGYAGPIDCAWKVDSHDWWRTFEINVRGSFHCSQAVLPAMVSREEGSIINIVSQAGVQRWPLCSAYAVSKSALIKLSENLAAEVKRQKIAIFSYNPGLLSIGLTQSLLTADLNPNSPPGKIAAWFRRRMDENRRTPLQVSIATLMALATGDFNALSGCFISAGDNLRAMLAAVSENEAAGLFSLQLKS